MDTNKYKEVIFNPSAETGTQGFPCTTFLFLYLVSHTCFIGLTSMLQQPREHLEKVPCYLHDQLPCLQPGSCHRSGSHMTWRLSAGRYPAVV